MPVWLTVLVTLFVFWTCFWLVVYQYKLWLVSFPLSKKTLFIATVSIFIPVCWLASSLIVGIIIITKNGFNLIEFSALVVFPCIILLSILMLSILQRARQKKLKKHHDDMLNITKKNCMSWVEQYSFLNRNKVDIQIFISKNNPVGKVIIHDVSEQEAILLKENESKLPHTVSLLIFSR